MLSDPSQELYLFGSLLCFSSLLMGGIFVVQRFAHKNFGLGRSQAPIATPTTLELADVQPSNTAQLEKMQQEIQTLRQEGLRLRAELETQRSHLTREAHQATFQQLQPLLTNYPSLRQMIQAKPDLPAKNIVSLFTPLDGVLEIWGYTAIGSAWEQVPYDPQIHQPDCTDLAPGDPVYIRFVGYRYHETILSPAKVSRTLPAGK